MAELFSGYGHIALSSITVYIFIVLALRLFGKKELAQLSVVDLVFILLISNAVQNAMVGTDSTLMGGLIAALSLFIINSVFKVMMYRFPKVSKAIQGHAVLLVYKGVVNHDNMAKVKLSFEELMEAVREHGAATIKDVDLAVLEVDGNISILSHEFNVKSSKKRKSHKIITKAAD
jgi:uncharacterized membrane protein YcaP (DUF421 family)